MTNPTTTALFILRDDETFGPNSVFEMTTPPTLECSLINDNTNRKWPDAFAGQGIFATRSAQSISFAIAAPVIIPKAQPTLIILSTEDCIILLENARNSIMHESNRATALRTQLLAFRNLLYPGVVPAVCALASVQK